MRIIKILSLLMAITSLMFIVSCAGYTNPRIEYANAQEAKKLKVPENFLDMDEAYEIPEIAEGPLISEPTPPDYQS